VLERSGWVIAAYSTGFGISCVALAFWLKNHGTPRHDPPVRAGLDAAFHP